MSRKASKNTKERPISPEMRAAMARNEAYSIEIQTVFERKYAHLDDCQLCKLAHEIEILGFKLRHMLWNRLEKQNQVN